MTNTLDLIIKNETLLGYRSFPNAINVQGVWIASSGFGFTEAAQGCLYYEVMHDPNLAFIFEQIRKGQQLFPTSLVRKMNTDFNTARRFMYLLTKCKEAWRNVQQYQFNTDNNYVTFLNSSNYNSGSINTPPPPYL